MCVETKQVIGRENATKQEIKARGWQYGGEEQGGGWTRMMVWIAKGRCGEQQPYDVFVEMEVGYVGGVWGGGVPGEGLAQHNAIPLMISHSI